MRFMLAVIFFGLSFVEANILIESRDEQFANSAQTLLRVRVFNDSKDTLQNVELRYFLSCKERPIILDKHHPQNLSAEIVTADSECPVLKISIPLLFPGMYPDSGGVALGLHFSDGSDFKKEADFSKPESDSFLSILVANMYRESREELFRRHRPFLYNPVRKFLWTRARKSILHGVKWKVRGAID